MEVESLQDICQGRSPSRQGITVRARRVLSLAVAITGMGVLIYTAIALIDTSISLEHARTDAQYSRNQRQALVKIVQGCTKSWGRREFLDLLDQSGVRYQAERDGSEVFVEGIVFRFEGEKLVEIGN
jgi:hypothetical protein